MLKIFLALFVITVMTVACAPAPEIVATAMAQTQAALPTDTPLPATAIQVFTPESTNTLTETPTLTLTPTSTPDIRVITADPIDILCAERDLLREGGYFIPQNFSDQLTNEEVTKGKTDRLKQYVTRTGRIDGWLVTFVKGNDPIISFKKYIRCEVASFQTVDGAQLAVREYNDAEIRPQFGYNYFIDSAQPVIGDLSFLIVNDDHKEFSIDFSYRNYRVIITSLNQIFDFGEIYYVAQKILEKLDDAPLSAP